MNVSNERLHHRVGQIGFSRHTQSWQCWHFWYYLNLEIKVDTIISYTYPDSRYHVKCKFASEFILLITITNLFPFKVVQKCQHCQLCVLRENSNVHIIKKTILHVILNV